MKKTIAFISLISLSLCGICYAQAPTGQIQRSMEILEKEQELRSKLEAQKKVYIKKIVVQGATLVPQEDIEELILPFQKRRLSHDEIKGILDSITDLYKQKGLENLPLKINYEIRKSCLKIIIEE